MYSALKNVFIIFILMSFLFISACGSQTPVDAYMDLEKAWADENWGKVWDGFQSESQQALCGSMASCFTQPGPAFLWHPALLSRVRPFYA